MNTVYNSFQQHFEIVEADTPTLIDQAYRLRYQVYCEERGYEDAARYPDGREFDEYDERAIHSLIRHKSSGEYVGVVRLVLPSHNGEGGMLPTEQHCKQGMLTLRSRVGDVPREQIGEISRFSVSNVFRRGVKGQTVGGVESSIDYRLLPHVTLGLIAAFIRMCAKHNIRYCYAVMEPTLLRLLTRFGVHFHPLGEKVEFRGVRIPSFFPAGNLLAIAKKRPDLWNLATDEGKCLAVGRYIQQIALFDHGEMQSLKIAK